MREQIHTHEPIRIKNRICQYLHPYYTTAPPLLHNLTHPLLQPHISYFSPKKKKENLRKIPLENNGRQCIDELRHGGGRRPPLSPLVFQVQIRGRRSHGHHRHHLQVYNVGGVDARRASSTLSRWICTWVFIYL